MKTELEKMCAVNDENVLKAKKGKFSAEATYHSAKGSRKVAVLWLEIANRGTLVDLIN